jgi:putative tryptophan/tyrosine transport system substrate-binding protein
LRTLLFTILTGLVFAAGNAFASDVLILQSMHVKPYDDALRGLRSVVKGDTRTVVLTDAEGADIVRIVRDERPELIVAIGADALRSVRKVRDVPIIHLMVLNPEKITDNARNVVGIEMNIQPEKYLSQMERLNLPRLKVGLFYDPEKSGALVKKIKQVAASMGIEINARVVQSPRDVPVQLKFLNGSCNIFWMLPDSTVVTPETVELLLLHTQQTRVPVVTFAAKYVDTGALFSLDIDGYDLGKQAGEMANRIIDGTDLSQIRDAWARKAVLKVNRKVAEKLGISLAGLETRQ